VIEHLPSKYKFKPQYCKKENIDERFNDIKILKDSHNYLPIYLYICIISKKKVDEYEQIIKDNFMNKINFFNLSR
jgi:hypothetical protein